MNIYPRRSRPSAAKLPLRGEAAPPRRSRLSTAQPSVFGSGARTSYIGREHDKETDLGFYGVRLYEPEYGRFLSTDVLWSNYLPLQPFQYAANNPVMALDDNGKEIIPINLNKQQITAYKKLIDDIRSLNDATLNSVLDYAESPKSKIHLYSMPTDRAYGSHTFSRLNQFNETLEDRFYDVEGRVGLTLQTPFMAGNNQADVIISAAVLASPGPLLLTAILDELNHVMSDGIDLTAELRDHKSLFSHLLMLHERGILTLPPDLYEELRDQIKAVEPSESEPKPFVEPARGADND